MSEPSDRNTRTHWRNWAGDESCVPAVIEHPSSTAELADVVVRAGTSGRRVRVAGAGPSFSDIACSDGVLVSLERMASVLDVDRSAGLVRVQAGITILALNQHLAAHGLALENPGH